jgi:hypothetical protein
MFAMRRMYTRVPYLVLAAGAIALASCKDSTDPVEEEPEVVSMRLTVGAQSVTVTTQGCTGCPLVISNNSVITAQFLGSDGEPDPVAVQGVFRLSVAIPTTSTGLSFTLNQANQFSGTFTRTSASATPFDVQFGLFHIEEAHDDFGPIGVSVVVQ